MNGTVWNRNERERERERERETAYKVDMGFWWIKICEGEKKSMLYFLCLAMDFERLWSYVLWGCELEQGTASQLHSKNKIKTERERER